MSSTSPRADTSAAPHSLPGDVEHRVRRWPGWASSLARLVAAGVWAWAGVAKMSDPDAAVRAVGAYRALPGFLIHPVAWGLPFAELAIAALLVLGVANRAAASVGAGLLVVFIAGITQAWAGNLQISCGCFGGGGPARADSAVFAAEVGRDLAFLALHAWLIWRPASRLALNLDR
jgi:uncharacterized membrane protein YphA (DoxX/SURF4 family)